MNYQDSSFIKYFSIIRDDRQQGKIKHKLIDILFIAVAATIANATAWEEIEAFAYSNEEWLKKYLELPYGIPSHDTIERIFRWIDPKQFEKCFIAWVQELAKLSEGTIVAIDGKTMRGAYDSGDKKSPIHIVSAWSSEQGLILGQVKTNEKSNEITAIPELLDLLLIKGCIVTIDAMGCQKDIAEKIVSKNADYVLALKGNQGNLHQDVVDFFDDAENNKFKDISYKYHMTMDKGHGRIEKRHYYLVDDIEWIDVKDNWDGLKSIGMTIRECEINGEKTIEKRYYISSLKGSAEEFGEAVRKHWGIESTHWCLDVVFKEDSRRVRKDNGPQNLAMLKRIALNILKKDKSGKKSSLSVKRYKACANIKYLQQVLIENIIQEN